MPTKSAKKNKGGLVASPPKAKVAKVVQPESEESSSESSESEEEVPVKAVAKAKAASIKKTAPPRDSDDDDDSSDDSDVPNGKATNGSVAPADGVKVAKKEESSSEEDSSEDEKPAVKAPAKPATQKKPAPKDESSEESDDSEDEKPVAKKAATPKAAPAKKAAADSDSSEEDDSEDEKPVAKKATPKATPAKKAVPAKKAAANSDDSSEEDDSEDEKPVAKKATPKAVPAKKAAADSDDSSEEDDSEDEKPVAKKATPKAAPAKKAVPAKKAAADSDDDSEEDDSDEDDSEEEEPKAKPVAKKATPVKAAQSDSDESDSDEDESEEEEPPKPPVLTATVSNAKGVTEKQLKKFFKTKGIKVKQIVKANKKSFTVDFQSAGDTMKAVDLSGQEVGGRSVKIEAEAPPAPASPKKAEKKAAKRPAPADDDVEEESDEEEEESEEEEVAGKRKKGGDAGAVTKKQKVDTSATEEVVTLFVGRLNNDTTAEAVKKLFKKNGIKCKDVRKMDKKRFGYVDLANAEDLDKAIALSGQELDGSEITVERAKPKNQSFSEPKGQTQQYGGRQERDTSADDRTLFVKGLADSVDEGKLQAFFSEATEVRLPQKEGYHRGFAYIVFPDKETAATVLSEKQGADLEGNALYLDYTGSKSSFKPRERSFNDSYGSRDGGDRRKSTGERGSSNVLFVKNLSFHLDEEGLKDAFPNATTARIAKFPDTQKPKGFGFVEFNSPDDAASAYDTMQNAEIDGRQVFLDFASPGGGRGRGGGRGGFGDRGGRGGRGGFGGRGGRGGYGDRGGFRGGRGGFRGGRGGGFGGEPQNKRKKFDDSD